MKVDIVLSIGIWIMLAIAFVAGMYFNKPAAASPVIKPVTCVVELYNKPKEVHEYNGTIEP
jgi:hypothetical protein